MFGCRSRRKKNAASGENSESGAAGDFSIFLQYLNNFDPTIYYEIIGFVWYLRNCGGNRREGEEIGENEGRPAPFYFVTDMRRNCTVTMFHVIDNHFPCGIID